MGKCTFKGGIHPYDGKELSKDKPIKELFPAVGVYSTSLNSPSFSMMIELHFPPVASVLGSIALTVPETDEWILADTIM